MEEGGNRGKSKAMSISSPSNSQQIISDDNEIDYSVNPEFYDPNLDYKDELWVEKKRQGRSTDAVLSCPGCFTTLCLECQRHEKYLTQYRAIFVVNCEVVAEKAFGQSNQRSSRGKKRGRSPTGSKARDATYEETLKQVRCSVCSADVGVMDEDEIYHFYNVLPSES